MGKFYVTTAIPYVNAPPHIGFAMEALQADILARYHREKGDETFFLTGTDEHGTKLFNIAKKEGRAPSALANKIAAQFEKLNTSLNISNDDFIRTTSDRHKAGAQKLWEALAKKGDIYKAKYTGLYCSGCEAYVLEKDLVENKCPTHKTAPDYLEEENYFFKLSKYSTQIRDLIKSDKLRIVPEARKNEMLNIIGEGLADVSFSRPKKNLPWGIEVPGDAEHVMYVWCDALSNYITALDYEGFADGRGGALFKKFWPANVHIIGKDILRFHAGIWIGMLLSAEIGVPKNIYVHGFITSQGQKMSKSLGNVVDPFETIEKYGVDAVRYYLSREIPTTDDGDFSKERFEALYNTELANNLGNLVNRVFVVAEKYFESRVPASDKKFDKDSRTKECKDFISRTAAEWQKNIEEFNLKAAIEEVLALSDFGNRYVEEMKPWVLAKENPDLLKNVVCNMIDILKNIGIMLKPFMPQTAEKILAGLAGDTVKKPPVLFPRLQ